MRTVEAEAEPVIVARLEELRHELARAPAAPVVPLAAGRIASKRAAIERRRERCLEAFMDGAMTREQMRATIAKLEAEVLRLDAEEAAAKRPNPLADAAKRRAVLAEVGRVALAWSLATPEAKRRIAGHLATEVRMEAGKPCASTWRSAEELSETARVALLPANRP